MQELEANKDLIEEKILRMSLLYQQVRDLPVVQLFVVAGCVMRGEIVELRQDCGHMFAPLPGTEQHVTNEERLAARLQDTRRQEAARLGFIMRGGVLEEERAYMRESNV